MKYILFILFLGFQLGLSSQGQNNDHKYDQKDLNFLFKQNKVEVFKFAFRAKKDTCLNVVIEEYVAGKKIKTINFYENAKPLLAMLDEPFTNFFPLLQDSSDTWVRFYLRNAEKGLELTPLIGDIQAPFLFEESSMTHHGSRAFDNIPKYLSSKQALIVYYSNNEGDYISCPAGTKISKIPELYHHVVILYADLIPNKK